MATCRDTTWTYQSHGFSYNENQRLVCYCVRICEEEVAYGDVEEGEGGDNRCGGYETHLACGFVLLQQQSVVVVNECEVEALKLQGESVYGDCLSIRLRVMLSLEHEAKTTFH